MEIYDANSVFTPTSPARLTFVEREEVNDQLVQALSTPGKQIIVYGPSGCGKTTLLTNKLEQIYENHITTSCTKLTSIESLLLSAFDQLGQFYTSEIKATKLSKGGLSLTADYLKIKAQISAERSSSTEAKQSRMVPPQLTAQNLAKFLGAAKCCWIIEDFHKVKSEEKENFSDLMKVFVDSSSEYKDVRIVAIGAVNTAREVVAYGTDMKNRVAEIKVPLMQSSQLTEIISVGEKLLNISINSIIKADIASYSSGLASIVHQLCLNLCFSANISQTAKVPYHITDEHLKEAIQVFLRDESDTLKSIFDKALKKEAKRKYEDNRLILSALSRLDNDGGTAAEILNGIRDDQQNYPRRNLAIKLKKLTQEDHGEIIQQDMASGRYYFTTPFYRAYALCQFKPSTYDDLINKFRDVLSDQIISTRVKYQDLFLTTMYCTDITSTLANTSDMLRRWFQSSEKKNEASES